MTHQKALAINLDRTAYGTFAEIGAGQEVARWFFHVGKASGTVAKTISAYDMNVSDAIYGPCERYVSRQRLQKMLDYEYALLLERLQAKRGATTRFFAYANTVATRSVSRRQDGHGWMGVRFQHAPEIPPSEILIHLRMLDKEATREQEALGVLGVNLLHGALYRWTQPTTLITQLLDELNPERMEVDMIRFSGPAFPKVDNRLMALQLVTKKLAPAAMFTERGETVEPSEILYNRPVLVERGRFRPFTNLTQDLIQSARRQFAQEPALQGHPAVVLLEISLNNLLAGGEVDPRDFLQRVDILGALGYPVLISSFGEYYRLVQCLCRYTSQPMGLALGIPNLSAIFNDKFYEDLEGGIMEAFGLLFKRDVTLYVYPSRDAATGQILTADALPVPAPLRHLYAHLLENHRLRDLVDYNPAWLRTVQDDVLAQIQRGNPAWESEVPPLAVQLIKSRGSFGYTEGTRAGGPTAG